MGLKPLLLVTVAAALVGPVATGEAATPADARLRGGLKPKQRFTPLVEVRRYSRYVSLRLEVRPLAGNLPYQVCWRNQHRVRRCAKGLLRGYSWNTPANDTREVGLRGMARTTIFTWHVGGRTVASRTVSTAPG